MDIGYIAIAHALVLPIIEASFTAYTLLYKYVFLYRELYAPTISRCSRRCEDKEIRRTRKSKQEQEIAYLQKSITVFITL